MMTMNFKKLSAVVFGLCFLASGVRGQTIQFTSVPPGYEAGTIILPSGFGGGMGTSPVDDRILYVSVGSFLDAKIAKVDLIAASSRIVASGPFGSVGGIAVLSATQMVLVDSAAVTGGPPDDTILLAQDLNNDGDFDDTGEITELITPILTGGDFTGAQARVVPAGNPSGIPTGSVILQTADGGGNAELLVVENPLGTPAFRPVGGPFFTGFDYNGGFDFDSQGNLIMGTATASFAGNVIALVNTNADEDIDAGESNVILDDTDLPFGISDLVIDSEDDAFLTTGGKVLTFPVPNDPLAQSASTTTFAETDAGFLSGLLLNSRTRPYEPAAGAQGATLVVSGFTSGFASATNLLVLRPSQPAAVDHWRLYR